MTTARINIDVKPLSYGWTVRSDPIANDLVFRSGRMAERAALRLADRLARVGMACEIRIHLKDGALGGRFFRPATGSVNGAPSTVARHLSPVLEPA